VSPSPLPPSLLPHVPQPRERGQVRLPSLRASSTLGSPVSRRKRSLGLLFEVRAQPSPPLTSHRDDAGHRLQHLFLRRRRFPTALCCLFFFVFFPLLGLPRPVLLISSPLWLSSWNRRRGGCGGAKSSQILRRCVGWPLVLDRFESVRLSVFCSAEQVRISGGREEGGRERGTGEGEQVARL
jgi:hypothetical protein